MNYLLLLSSSPVNEQEDELREEGSEKHAHLNEDLHVLIEVYAPAADAYNRLAYGIAEVRKYLIPVSLHSSIYL